MTAAFLRRSFAYEEVRDDPRLRLACAALLLFCCHTFGGWHAEHAAVLSTYGVSTGNTLPSALVAALGGPAFPPPFWTLLHLSLLYFLGLLGLLFLFRRECLASLVILAILFVSKAYYYASDLRLAADFHHLHLLLTFLFLFSREKLFFLRVGLIASYWLLARAKLGASWLGGEYFLSTRTPPVVWRPELLCPLWTLWEALGPLAWLSRSARARAAALGVFGAAHLCYAAVNGPDFALLMLPLLAAAFWGQDRPAHEGYHFRRSHAAAWACLACCALVRLPPAEDNRAGECRVVVDKGAKRLAFSVEWPWSRPTLLDDGSRAAAGVPSYRGEFYLEGRVVERLPWNVVVRDGENVVLNPYFFLTLPNSMLEPYPFRLFARRLCRGYRPDHAALTLDVRRDGRRAAERVLDVADLCAEDSAAIRRP